MLGSIFGFQDESNIDVCMIFCMSFANALLVWFLEAPNLENGAPASTGARFSQNRMIEKRIDLG